MIRRCSALLLVLCAALALPALPSAHAQGGDASAKPVLAYYFPWYEPSDWNAARMSDLPAPAYSGGDDGTIARHLQQAADSGIDGFICSWFGPSEPRLTARCDKLLKARPAATSA